MKIGLVGTGGMGANHVEASRHLDGIDIAAIADCDIESAKKYTNMLGRAYSSMEEMLAHEALDAVDICIPSFLRAQYALT